MIGSLVRRAYRGLFGSARFYRLNLFLHGLSLRGMGILNYENDRVSGEAHLLRWALARPAGDGGHVVLDVGANTGDYASGVRRIDPNARVFAFEPHPGTFRTTAEAAALGGFTAINAACGAEQGRMLLYDYDGHASGSQHASLYRDVIEGIHGQPATPHEVEVTTVDAFVEAQALRRILLLKIDTEGHEAAVLRGAQRAIAARQIDLIQFEFNEMHVASRTFFRDFVELLPGYRLYRVLRDGFVPLSYRPVHCEIFAFQNILAVRDDLAL